MTFPQPNAGDPIARVMSARLWKTLVDVANAWERGELRKPDVPQVARTSIVLESAAAAVKGEAVGVARDVTPADAEQFFAQPYSDAEPLVWPTLSNAVILEDGIAANTTGSNRLRTFLSTEITGGSGNWLFHDPANTKKFIRASSGIARILLVDSPSSTVLVDTTRQQTLFGFELNEDWPSGGTQAQAKLYGIGGELISADTPVQDQFAQASDMEAGERGVCVFAGDSFHVISGSPGSIDCEAICEKCGAFSTPTGDCDLPAIETGCCEENCEFTSDSITNLLFTGSQFTYSQNGQAVFTDSQGIGYCRWTVPVGGSGPETQATVEFNFTSGWSVTIGLEGSQEATSSGCGSSSPINLTQGTATASFDQTSSLCYEDCAGDPAKCLIEEQEKFVKIGALNSATGTYPGGGWFSDSIDSCGDVTCCTTNFTMKDDQTFLPLVPGPLIVAFDIVTIGSLQVSGNAGGTVFSDTAAQFTLDESAGTMTVTFSDSGVDGTIVFDVTVCNEPV